MKTIIAILLFSVMLFAQSSAPIQVPSDSQRELDTLQLQFEKAQAELRSAQLTVENLSLRYTVLVSATKTKLKLDDSWQWDGKQFVKASPDEKK